MKKLKKGAELNNSRTDLNFEEKKNPTRFQLFKLTGAAPEKKLEVFDKTLRFLLKTKPKIYVSSEGVELNNPRSESNFDIP